MTIRILLLSLVVASADAFAKSGIRWQHWSPAPFAEAADNNKMLIVNVGYEGCTACRFMEENTFSDPTVIDLINRHFVAIQVDSEARPDIGERYSDWAWPATAFLHPDGTQIFALRGSRRPGKFIPLLENLIQRHADGALKTDQRAPYGVSRDVVAGPLSDIQKQVRAQLDRSFDDERGGWGRGAKILEYPGPTLQLMLRGHLYGDARATRRGLQTAAGFARQVDDVWGGVFYASVEEWTNTIKEKRLETQAAALRIFSEALQISGDSRYVDSIANVDRYLQSHMRSVDGLYFSSQKDLLSELKGMGSDAYYALGDGERRALGYPKTDHATYTDLNMRIVSGYLTAFQATGDSSYRDKVVRTAEQLVATRWNEPGWFTQLVVDPALERDERAHVLVDDARLFLRTQAYAGLAMLRLFQATQDQQWLARCRLLAATMLDQLYDKNLGGFFATSRDDDLPVSLQPRKPLEDNAAAARYFYWLGVLDKNEAWRNVAEQTIRAAATPAIVKREGRITGNLALTLELLIAGYVEMSVVGDPNDKNAQALYRSALTTYEPRKIVHFEAPGRYPERERASLYVCNDTACSLPITDPSTVAEEAAKFTPVAFANQ